MHYTDYQCSTDARAVLAKWATACEAQSGSWDRFTDPESGQTCRWEPVRPQADGAATGKVWRVEDGGVETEGNGWRVESSGRVTRAPRFLLLLAEATP